MTITANQYTKRWLAITFCLFGACVSANETKKQPAKANVVALLQGYEWSINAELVLGLGEDVDLVLMEVASDATLMNGYRLRALTALSLFNNDRVADYLEAQVDEAATTGQVQHAFQALVKGFSSSRPKRVEEEALKMLKNKNPHVRISAASSLRHLNTATTQSAYRHYMSQEKEAWVRTEIEKRK